MAVGLDQEVVLSGSARRSPTSVVHKVLSKEKEDELAGGRVLVFLATSIPQHSFPVSFLYHRAVLSK